MRPSAPLNLLPAHHLLAKGELVRDKTSSTAVHRAHDEAPGPEARRVDVVVGASDQHMEPAQRSHRVSAGGPSRRPSASSSRAASPVTPRLSSAPWHRGSRRPFASCTPRARRSAGHRAPGGPPPVLEYQSSLVIGAARRAAHVRFGAYRRWHFHVVLLVSTTCRWGETNGNGDEWGVTCNGTLRRSCPDRCRLRVARGDHGRVAALGPGGALVVFALLEPVHLEGDPSAQALSYVTDPVGCNDLWSTSRANR